MRRIAASGALALAACYTPPAMDLVDEVPLVPEGACAADRIEWVACTIDGDTLDLDRCGEGERLRLLGIDAPELAHDGNPAECWAEQAHEALEREIGQREVLLTFDRDCLGTFGRTLAYAWRSEGEIAGGQPGDDALLLNRWMLEQGHARLYDEDFGTPLRLAEELQAAEAEARSNNLGLWGACEGAER